MAGKRGAQVALASFVMLVLSACFSALAAATEHGPPNATPGEVRLTVARASSDPSGATLTISYVDTPPPPPSPCVSASCSPNFQMPYNIKVWVDKADGTSAGGSWTLVSTSLPSVKCQSGGAAPAISCDSGGRDIDNTDDALPDHGMFVLRAQQAPPAGSTAEIVVEGYTINTDATVPVPGGCSGAQAVGAFAPVNSCDPCATERAAFKKAEDALYNATRSWLVTDMALIADTKFLATRASAGRLDNAAALAALEEHDKLVLQLANKQKVGEAAKKRYDEAKKKYDACLKAHPSQAADAARQAATGAFPRSAAATTPPGCPTSAYATASRDAALIAASPKLAPLVRKIIREQRTGPTGTRQAGHDLKRVRQTLQREQKLAKAISAALKPCTSA